MSCTDLSRRDLLHRSLAVAGLGLGAALAEDRSVAARPGPHPIRLGGPVFGKHADPAAWIADLREHGYAAAYCPLQADADDATVRAYARAAADAGIVIAEVGAWSNPLSPDAAERKAARDKCRRQLHLADRIGARCCVNISGSRGPQWAGPDPQNLTTETFDMIVEVTRALLDEVRPTRTTFALEAMPWSYPDSVDNYLRLIAAIDRPRFAVHLDPVNLVVSPQVYFRNGAMIREAFAKLGPHIRSCHAKDILLDPKVYTPQLSEVPAGQGFLDYRAFLTALSRTGDIPLMLEHLPNDAAYRRAATHIRGVGRDAGLSFA